MESVVLFGKDILAIRIAEWFMKNPNYELLGVIPVIPEPEWAVSITAWCQLMRQNCLVTGNYEDLPENFY